MQHCNTATLQHRNTATPQHFEKHCEAQNLEEAFRDSCKNTLLHFAMIGDHQIVKQLLEKLSQLDNDKVVLNQIANSMTKIHGDFDSTCFDKL